MNIFSKVGLKLFGKWLKKRRYVAHRRTLTRARIPTPVLEYVAMTWAVFIVAGAVGAVMGFLLGYLLGVSGISLVLLMVFLTAILGLGTYEVLMVYPSMRAGGLREKIDLMMPEVASYLYAMTSGGVGLRESFKSLSELGDEYGEAAKECGMVVREVEYFGRDIPTALANAAEASPSDKFRDFLSSLLTVVQTGGNIPNYFADKSKQYRTEFAQQQKTTLESLGILAESYVIALGLGPLLILLILMTLGTMGMFYGPAIYIVTYVVIPMGSIGFLVVLGSFIKGRGKRVKVIPEGAPSRRRAKRKQTFGVMLRNLKTLMSAEPVYTMMVSIPVAMVFLMLTFLLVGISEGVVIFAIAIVLLPLILVYETQTRRTREVERWMPDFLRGLSSAIRSGLPLSRAISTLSTTRLGALTPYLKKMQATLHWGGTSEDALTRFAESTRSVSVSRVVTLMKGSTIAGGKSDVVLDIASEDFLAAQTLERERSGAMASYMLIVYVTFATFVFTAFALCSFMFTLSPQTPTGVAGGIPLLSGGMNPALVKQIFFHAVLIQGFCSGLIAGKMSGGNVLAGLKHSLIMLVAGYVIFILFIL